MAGSCSSDLRRRVLAAVEQGASPGAAARRFAVGRSTACRRVAAARDEGRCEAKPMHGGPAPRIGGAVEAAMPEPAGGPRHLGLAEIAVRLAEATGVRGHPTTHGAPGAAAGGPDVKEAEPARGRAGARGRGPGA